MSAELFTPDRIRQLRMMGDIKYPMEFSPISTSSPLSARRRNVREMSFVSYHSFSSDSSGNVTGRAIQGIEDSVIDESQSKIHLNSSDLSVATALEYVPPSTFARFSNHESVTRPELIYALKNSAIKDFDVTSEEAEKYATIACERILWDHCRIWKGTVLVVNKHKYLQSTTEDGFSDAYLRRAVSFCIDRFTEISNSSNFKRENVTAYFKELGCPTHVINRVFENSIIRKSCEDRLSLQEISHLIFAFYGTDDPQSFEYWFRVLGTNDQGELCFSQLRMYYLQILAFLKEFKTEGLPFVAVIEQFCDMMGTKKWTLSAFKKNPTLSYRILDAFTNGRKFFENETDERMNRDRLEDEKFGLERSIWQRTLDRIYDTFYADMSSSFNEDSAEFALE